jgi:hypothetical protein
MSYHLIDFTQDNIDFNFDNLIIGKKINSKYYIYYLTSNEDNSVNEEPKEIYIKLPKIRLIYKLGTSKYNQENIPLYPNYNLLNKFINFIKELEENIYNCFATKYPDIIISSIINKKNNINTIKVNINDNYIISSNNNKLKINDFKINSEINLILKFSFIWMKDNYKIGLSSELYQVKYNLLPFDSNINFFPDITINISAKKPNETEKQETQIKPKDESPIRFKLIASDLLLGKQKLKPVQNIN